MISVQLHKIDLHKLSNWHKNQIKPIEKSNSFFAYIGCETWNTTKSEEGQLQTTQRTIERKICNISKLAHIRCAQIRKMSQIRDVTEAIYEIKRRWAGHIARQRDNR